MPFDGMVKRETPMVINTERYLGFCQMLVETHGVRL